MRAHRPDEKRGTERHRFDSAAAPAVSFRWPDARGASFAGRLNDVSLSGLSFVMEAPVPPLEPGDALTDVATSFDGHTVRGEIVVMHVTPSAGEGAVCGGLFFPASDEDLLAVRRACAAATSR